MHEEEIPFPHILSTHSIGCSTPTHTQQTHTKDIPHLEKSALTPLLGTLAPLPIFRQKIAAAFLQMVVFWIGECPSTFIQQQRAPASLMESVHFETPLLVTW